MNKKLLYVGGAIIIIILVIAGYLIYTPKKSPKSDNTTPEESTTIASEGKQSLRKLLSSKVAQQCTFIDADTKSTGMVYIAGGKMRSDYETTSETITVKSHVIMENETIYMWIDGQSQGYQMKMPSEDQITPAPQTDTGISQSATDINKEIDYKCTAWIVNNSYFEKPSGMTFQSLDAIISQSQEDLEDQKTDMCKTCDNIPAGEAQDQCRESLGCN